MTPVSEYVVSFSELQFYEHETKEELSDQSSTSILEDKEIFFNQGRLDPQFILEYSKEFGEIFSIVQVTKRNTV